MRPVVATQGNERLLSVPLVLVIVHDLGRSQGWEVPLGSALARGYWVEVEGFVEYEDDGLPVTPWPRMIEERADRFIGTPDDFEFQAPPRHLLDQAVRHGNGDFTITNGKGYKTRVEFRSGLWETYRRWLAEAGISAPLTESDRQHWCGAPDLEEQAIDD